MRASVGRDIDIGLPHSVAPHTNDKVLVSRTYLPIEQRK